LNPKPRSIKTGVLTNALRRTRSVTDAYSGASVMAVPGLGPGIIRVIHAVLATL
jgi:hypothetical protein